jgi:transketolase
MEARRIRQLVLEMSKRANVGHIGSSLSIAEIIAVLYGSVLQIADPHDAQRDRFVLSKGHAAPALYAALHLRGWLSAEALTTFCRDGSLLGVHPEHALTGVDFSTGSLGMGLSFAAGAAYAARLQQSPRRVYALLSDAECNEGSVWEAALFAGHHRLGQLTAVIDLNGQQALGATADILAPASLGAAWQAFGWQVLDVDGHDSAALTAAFAAAAAAPQQPTVLLAKTVFGKGVSFMHQQLKWHYLPLSDAEYAQALREIAGQA